MFHVDGADPQIVAYHPVRRFEAEHFAFMNKWAAVFLFQFFPQFRTCFFQIRLGDVEHTENLHFGIHIILFLLIVRQILVIIILDLLLSFLVDTGEGSQHDGKRFLTFQYRNPRQFLAVLARLVQSLHAIEGAEPRNSISFLFAVQHEHQRIHTIVFTAGKITGPLECPLGEPGLLPVLTDGLQLFNHHFSEQVKSLVFAVGAVCIAFPVTCHIIVSYCLVSVHTGLPPDNGM